MFRLRFQQDTVSRHPDSEWVISSGGNYILVGRQLMTDNRKGEGTVLSDQEPDAKLKNSVLFVTIVSSFVTPFMASSITVALPAIQNDLHMDAVLLAWIATAYLLSCAVFLVPFGKIADIYGRKRIFISGMLIFTLFSVLCGLAPNSATLLAFRIIQGIGTSMIFTTGMAILTSAIRPQERGKAIGLTVAAVYIGLSIGPVIGGLLTQYLTWRSVFFFAGILGVPSVYLSIWKLKTEWYGARGEKLDVFGSVLYAIALTLLMHGLSTIPDVTGILEIVSGLVLFFAFVRWEQQTRWPVFELSLFTNNRGFAFSSLAALINYSATFMATFLLSLYLQYIKGLDPRQAGLVLIFQPVTMAVLSPFAGRLSDRVAPRIVASIGMAISAAGLFGMIFLGDGTSLAYIIANLILLGSGFALFSSPNMNAIMSSVEPRFYGLASGAVSSMRLLGQMTSMGITTMIFSIFIGRVKITDAYHREFLTSIEIAFVISVALCLVGIFASLARGDIQAVQEKP